LYIPVILQNAIFVLSLFALAASKKIRNRVGYSSLFSRRQSQKSSRPKTSILKDHGYKRIIFLLLLVLGCSEVFAQDNVLTGIKIQPLPNNRLRIDFKFSEPLKQPPASFITQKPPRLVLDFIESTSQLRPESQTKKISIGSVQDYQIVAVNHRVRAIFNLSASVSYSGSCAGRVYTLMVNGGGNALIPRPKELFVTHRPVNAKHIIRNVNFGGNDKNGGRLTIDVSDGGIPVEITQVGNKIIANFMSTKVRPALRKRFDVVDFHSPTQTFDVQQAGQNTLVTLFNNGDYGHYAYQVNKQFIIDVFPLSEEELQQQKLKKQVFAGKRISLNFQDIQLRAVLQLLADFTGVNVVVSDKVAGNITLRLNDVPWDQALDIILTTQGLEKRQVGNVILIDTAKEFDTRENNALKAEEAARKLAPIRAELLQINYAKAAELAAMLKDKDTSLLSDRGKVSVDVRTNTIWLQDTGARIAEVRNLIQQLDIPVKQVSIEARIVDLKKDCALDLGVRWGISKPSHLSGTLEGANELAKGTAPADVPIADRLNLDLIATPALGLNPASVGVALAKLGSGVLLDLELSALESEGRAEIIASPRLMTTNQQPAVIESGEDIPYQESTSSGATAVAFKKAVLSLKVTPQITPDGKLLLALVINQDADSGQRVQGVPIILTKSINTTVLVNNGQTIVLGGIYQQDKNNTIVRIPFLGQIPGVGHLFRKSQTSSTNEELLIFITPRIIANSMAITTVEGAGRKNIARVMVKRNKVPADYVK